LGRSSPCIEKFSHDAKICGEKEITSPNSPTSPPLGYPLDGNTVLSISTMPTTPFGVGGRPRKPRTCVEHVPRIGVKDLAGVPFTGSAREEVRVVTDGRPEVLEVVCDARFFGGDGQRFFLCPACSRKVQHLYLRDRLACRRCSGLDYASKHTCRQGLNRVRRLREKIGALPSPLAPIPPRPPHWRRDYWARALARLALAESVIAGQLHAMIPRVRRRLKRDRHSARGT
jgi:hypothetical protein